MDCPKCHKKNIGKDHKCNAPKVIQIEQCPEIVTFHTVEVPASVPEEDLPPANGKYRNTVVRYLSSGNAYLYSSDGIPVRLTPEESRDFNKLNNRPKYNGVEMNGDTNIPSVEAVQGNLDTEVSNRIDADNNINSAINKDVLTSIVLNSDPSTSVVQLDATKTNIKTSATSVENIPLPVASTTQAGVMNSATFNAVSENTSNINALANGAVALSGLSASPTQQELTTAWETETGISSLMNRAGIYDIDNDKIWTYYTNTDTWYPSANTPTVVVNQFTNTSLGTIKGSTNVGQVFAENDGTGSVNGWDSLSARVSDLERKETPMTFQRIELGFNMDALIYRYGNLVIVISSSTVGANLFSSTAGQEILLVETIPEGFRPINEGTINSTYQDADADRNQFHSGISWDVHADGTMGLRYKTSVSSPHGVRVAVLGVWITGDDWPTEEASA